MAAMAQCCLIGDVSEARENQSLLNESDPSQLQDMKKTCACSLQAKYRLPIISEKGAIVMIVWNLFFAISFFTCSKYTEYTYSVIVVFVASSAVLYPLIGWLADTRFGKFKVLRTASFILMTAIILKNVAIFIIHSGYIFYSSLLMLSVAGACYLSCIFPFVTEQSVGASAEELSFTVHWLLWGITTGYCIATLTCLLIGEYQEVSQFFLALISFIVAFVCLESCHHLVMSRPVVSNPIKLIAQVLNYARKHKYPERRSALTYWEEDYPSRLDLGKDKYGGPFTFEQVEDVKTVLRLIPLVGCINIFQLEFWQKNPYLHYYSNCSSNYAHAFFQFSYDTPHFYPALLHSAGFPIYNFLIFPLIRRHIFTIIRTIAMGMIVVTMAFLTSAILELVEAGQMDTSVETMCIFGDLISNKCPTYYKIICIIAPELLKSVGVIITCSGMYELIIAQTPHQIKSLLLCITAGIGGVFIVAGFGVHKLLTTFPVHSFPGCLFYYYICYLTLGTLAFILYVLVAKWYKLRIRDDIIPYHLIAEDFFEREQVNRSAYFRAQQLDSSDED